MKLRFRLQRSFGFPTHCVVWFDCVNLEPGVQKLLCKNPRAGAYIRNDGRWRHDRANGLQRGIWISGPILRIVLNPVAESLGRCFHLVESGLYCFAYAEANECVFKNVSVTNALFVGAQVPAFGLLDFGDAPEEKSGVLGLKGLQSHIGTFTQLDCVARPASGRDSLNAARQPVESLLIVN